MKKDFMKKYKKFIFLLLIVGLLFFSFLLFYNKEEEILAQEEFVWECGEEIPIGEAIDGSIFMLYAILNSADKILEATGGQLAAVNQISQIPIPQECKAERCETGCDTSTGDICHWESPHCTTATITLSPGVPCPPFVPEDECIEVCPMGVCGPPLGYFYYEQVTCICPDNTEVDPSSMCQVCEDVVTCEVRDCSGNACPPDLLASTVSNIWQISNLYSGIPHNVEVIENAVGARDAIIDKLEQAREQLAECATPASGYVEEEEIQRLETLFSCEEAEFLRILPEEQEGCYPSNYFCCKPVEIQR